MGILCVKRKFSVPASGVKMKIYIDSVLCAKIWFTGVFEKSLSAGKHCICCEAAGIESEKIYFEIGEHQRRNIELGVGFESINYSFN